MRIFKNNIFLWSFFLLLTSSCSKSEKAETTSKQEKNTNNDVQEHKAHLSSAWYSQIPSQLHAELDGYFDLALNHFYVEADPYAIKALIVPHAGYYYSGLCAATAYQTLLATKNLYAKELKNKRIDRVIILAPSHRALVQGIALPDYTLYKTIFGDLLTDESAIDVLAKHESFKVIPEAHAPEHAIEMQLLFLQKTIEQFKIVPLVVGHLSHEKQIDSLCQAIKKIITPSTLLVISSDFMHHGSSYDYELFKKDLVNQIRLVDSLAVEAITKKSFAAFDKIVRETGTTICGQNPIRLLLRLIETGALGAVEPRLACYYTSAHMIQARKHDAAIDVHKLLSTVADTEVKDSVSYVGMVFTQQKIAELKKQNQLTGFEKMELLKTARESIKNELRKGEEKLPEHYVWPIISPGVEKTVGAFVTLETKDGALRGCIGQIAAERPLYQTVVEMAQAAAFKDTRFKPVTEKELNDLVLEISILGAPESVSSFQEIVLGTHGIILKKFAQDGTLQAHAVFLPHVPTSYGWDIRTTLMHLSIKAGLGPEGWKQDCQFQVFEGFEIKEAT